MFEWRTDQKEGWERPVISQTAVSPQFPRQWRRWLQPLLLLTMLLVGLILLSHRRTDQVVAAAERDLLASHNFVQSAASNQDGDLFLSILAKEDLEWVKTQHALADNGLLLNRPQLNLSIRSSPDGVDSLSDIQIELAPDLQTAVVYFQRAYSHPDFSQPLQLHHTAVFQKGPNNWQYTAPDNSFWQGWVTEEFDRLKITYPKRDQEIARRLAATLNHSLGNICQHLPDLHCRADWQLDLRLETNAQSLLEMADLGSFLSQKFQVELPTPTIFGLPFNETEYQLLEAAYEKRIMQAAIADLVNYRCCQNGQFFRALLDWQLVQLGLQEWPIQSENYHEILRRDLTLVQLNKTWVQSIRSQEDWQLTYALIAFLIEKGTLSPVEMQRQLAQTADYFVWLASLKTSLDEADWDAFVVEQSQSATAEPPAQMDGLTAVCRNQEGLNSRYTYRLPAASWEVIELRVPKQFVELVPDDQIASSTLSPNGQFELAFARGNLASTPGDFVFYSWRNELLLTNHQSEKVYRIGIGGTPFWLSNQLLGYVALSDESKGESQLFDLWSYNPRTHQRRHLLNSEALRLAVDESDPPNQLIILHVLPNPKNEQQLIVAASSSYSFNIPSLYFLVDLDEAVSVSFLAQFEEETTAVFAPDPRWVEVLAKDGRLLTLIDLQEQKEVPINTQAEAAVNHLWTPDQASLIQFRENYLLLYTPETKTHQSVAHPFESCHTFTYDPPE